MIRQEIGGYFGMEQSDGEVYYPSLKKLNTARNALLYLLKARKIEKLYIPYYLCDAVSRLCDRYGYVYEYYCVDQSFLPVLSSVPEDAWVYIVNYYGQMDNETLRFYKKRYPNMIVDNVQAFFQEPLPGVDTIYSCRKYFGVPDGAFLATDVNLAEELPIDESRDRMLHILGRYEKCASDFYEEFKQSDEQFYELPLREMSKITENLLRSVDYEKVKAIRNENYCLLSQLLGNANGLKVKMVNGAYCYPFLCENGELVRKSLAQQKIYVPKLWPNIQRENDPVAYNYGQNILPLPCDQRYNKADMRVMAELLLKMITK